MLSPYRYSLHASCAVKTRLRECSDCARWFEPLEQNDIFCDDCWNNRELEDSAND